MLNVDALLALPEDEFVRQCKFEPYKSGGPGGQKRNKTASAAKMTHVASGISAHSSDFRSQAENRKRALHRLRFKLAAECRTPIEVRGYDPPAWLLDSRTAGKLTTNVQNPIYARLAAHVLDVYSAANARVADAAALLNIPSSNLAHFFKAEPAIWTAAAKIRAGSRLPPLG